MVAFDGDDTLWHSEGEFIATQDRLRTLVAPYVDPDELDARLLAADSRYSSLDVARPEGRPAV